MAGTGSPGPGRRHPRPMPPSTSACLPCSRPLPTVTSIGLSSLTQRVSQARLAPATALGGWRRSVRCRKRGDGERFLEPQVGPAVVERVRRLVAVPRVQPPGLRQLGAGIQPEPGQPLVAGRVLDGAYQQATGGGPTGPSCSSPRCSTRTASRSRLRTPATCAMMCWPFFSAPPLCWTVSSGRRCAG
jgi:hypothetical protein